MRVGLVAVLLLTSTSHASPDYALAVNSPVSIVKRFAYGVSGYRRLDEHQALRASYASYESDYLWEDEGDAALSGRKHDLSITWVYFPRRVWDGALVDLGALWRRHHAVSYDYCTDSANWTLDSNTFAARAMVGWSWLMFDHAFIAVAGGASAGYELATVIEPMDKKLHASRLAVFPESYLRFGAAF